MERKSLGKRRGPRDLKKKASSNYLEQRGEKRKEV